MNRMLLIVAVAILSSGAARAQTTKGQVAFVDFERVYTNYFKVQLADDQFVQMQASYLGERNAMLKMFADLQEAYKKLRDQSVSTNTVDIERPAIRRDAERKLMELRQFEERINRLDAEHIRKVEEQRKRVRDRLTAEIQERMRGYAKAKGFSAILDRAIPSVTSPGILYHGEELDVTEDVIREINR